MKDEIKEINIKFPGQILDYVDTKEHLLELFNCITNLQEELKYQKQAEQEYNEKHIKLMKKYKELQEENERLKEIAEEHKNCTRKHWQQKCAEHCANEMIYKSRIDEAIEYINNLSNEPNIFGHYGIDSRCKEWLLNILNGGDEEI